MTPPEVALWNALCRPESGLRFRRQHPARRYVLDFYCAPVWLAVEVDGEAHGFGDRLDRDAKHDSWLEAQGVHVLRYTATEVLRNPDGVVGGIIAVATRLALDWPADRCPPPLSPSMPPPPGGGGIVA